MYKSHRPTVQVVLCLFYVTSNQNKFVTVEGLYDSIGLGLTISFMRTTPKVPRRRLWSGSYRPLTRE